MKDVGKISVVTQDEMQMDLRAMFRGAIRASLNTFLEEELEQLDRS